MKFCDLTTAHHSLFSFSLARFLQHARQVMLVGSALLFATAVSAQSITVSGTTYNVAEVTESAIYQGRTYSLYTVFGCVGTCSSTSGEPQSELGPLLKAQEWYTGSSLNYAAAEAIASAMPTPSTISGPNGAKWLLFNTGFPSGFNTSTAAKWNNGGLVRGSGSSEGSLYYTISVPKVSISSSDNEIAVGGTKLLNVIVTSGATGLQLSDFSVQGGAVSALTDNGNGLYTVLFTHDGTSNSPSVSLGDNVVSIAATGVYNIDGAEANNTYQMQLPPPPITITLENVTVSGASGANNTFIIGDTVTVAWDNTATGDNNTNVNNVTVDFSRFGGGAAVVAENNSNIWTATYVVRSGSIDSNNAVINITVEIDGGIENRTLELVPLPLDNIAPSVVISSPRSVLNALESTRITFTFSEPPTDDFGLTNVVVSSGTLEETFVKDSLLDNVFYAVYTPDPNVETIATIEVPNGNYTDLAGNKGSGNSLNLTIDTLAPTLLVTSAESVLGANDETIITFSFSEPVIGFESGNVVVSNGSINNFNRVDSVGQLYQAVYTPAGQTQTEVFIGVENNTYTDVAGNPGLQAFVEIYVDNVAPELQIVAEKSWLKIDEVAALTLIFSEPPIDFDVNDINSTNGAISDLVVDAQDPSLYTAKFTPVEGFQGIATISVATASYTDAVGNFGRSAQLELVIDTSAPLLAITLMNPLVILEQSTMVLFEFSEVPVGFTADDVIVSQGELSNFVVDQSDARQYSAVYRAPSGIEGFVNIAVAAGSYTDDFGNLGVAAQASLAVDTIVPSVVISAADEIIKAGASTAISFEFSEAVQDFTLADVMVKGGTLAQLATTDAVTYTAVFTPQQEVETTARLAIDAGSYRDLAGNAGEAGTAEFLVDTIVPSLQISADDEVIIAGADTLVRFMFSEPPQVFGLSNITVAGGTLSEFTAINGNNSGFSALFTPATETETTAIITVAAGDYVDAAGNPGEAAELRLEVDTIVPTVTLVGPEGTVTTAFSVEIKFSENVTGLTVEDVYVTDGRATELSGEGANYTVVIDPTLGKKITVTIPAGVAEDRSGNLNIASNVFEVQAGSPAAEFEKYKEEIRAVVVDEAERSLRSAMNGNRRLVQNARDRFISGQQQLADCSNEQLSADQQRRCRNKLEASNGLPFAVNGQANSGTDQATAKGEFLQQSVDSGDEIRRLLFADFDYQKDDDATTATVSGKVAWEWLPSDNTLMAYFVGVDYAHSDISGSFDGDHDRHGLSAGVYAVHQLSEALYVDAYLSVGLGQNSLEMHNDVLALTSDYVTQSSTFGAALTGVIKRTNYEFWPELSVSYGRTWIGNIGFTGRAYGLVDDTLSLNAGHVTLATMILRPEIRLPLDDLSLDESALQLSFAPRVLCEWVQSNRDVSQCGIGSEVGFSGFSRNGLTTFNAKILADKLSDSSRSSIQLSIQHKF